MAKLLPKPKPIQEVDYIKVGDLHGECCPRCGVNHGDFFTGGLDIKHGRAFCHACGRLRGSVKKAAPRRRRDPATRPVVAPAVPTSSPRPREHRAAPRGRDGTERDDGSGDDGGHGEPPPQRSHAPFSGRSVR